MNSSLSTPQPDSPSTTHRHPLRIRAEDFERIDDNGDPNDGHTLDINNGGGAYDERRVVDPSFLDLVRLGVTPPDDAHVVGSLPEVDATIKVDTPDGPMWYRYNHDGYGEKADGRPYDGTGVGRLWANDGYLLPEQAWDRADAFGFRFGERTGSATPLAWSMAQYVRLAHSIDAGRPVETPALVAARYAGGALPAGPALTVAFPPGGTTTDQAAVAVSGTTDAAAVYVNAAGQTS